MRFELVVPDGLAAGDVFEVDAGDAGTFDVAVPDGCHGGMLIDIELPGGSADEEQDTQQQQQHQQPMVEVEIPAGATSGLSFLVETHGCQFSIVTPEGFGPGDMLQVALPMQAAGASDEEDE
eukprot:3786598-Prymnesium_polylepis.1